MRGIFQKEIPCPQKKLPRMQKTYRPTKKFQCIWTTLQSRVISFEKVPGIYDTLLEVSSRCTEISWQVVTFSSCLVGFFNKKRLINKLLWLSFLSILSLLIVNFVSVLLPTIATYAILLKKITEIAKNRNTGSLPPATVGKRV